MRIIEILLDTGASPNATNAVGSNAIHLAIRYGRRDVVNVLLEQGAVVDEQCYHVYHANRGYLLGLDKQAIEELLMEYSDQ